jgi:hypothetical protein
VLGYARVSWCTFCYLSLLVPSRLVCYMTAFCCAASEGNRRSRFGTWSTSSPPVRQQPRPCTPGAPVQLRTTLGNHHGRHQSTPRHLRHGQHQSQSAPHLRQDAQLQSQVFPAGLSTNSRRASAHNPYAATNGTSAVTSASARGNNPYQVMPPPRRYSLVIPTRPVTGSMNGSSQKEKPRAATGTRP